MRKTFLPKEVITHLGDALVGSALSIKMTDFQIRPDFHSCPRIQTFTESPYPLLQWSYLHESDKSASFLLQGIRNKSLVQGLDLYPPVADGGKRALRNLFDKGIAPIHEDSSLMT